MPFPLPLQSCGSRMVVKENPDRKKKKSKSTLFYAYKITTRMTFIVRNTGRINCCSCMLEPTVLDYF